MNCTKCNFSNYIKKGLQKVMYQISTYQNRMINITVKEYTKMDTDIVRLLYHPKMKPGLNSKQTARTIKKILGSEKG